MLLLIAVSSCNSSKKIVYMQDRQVGVPTAITNYNEIKVRPGDQLSISVSCKDPALAAMFNPTQQYNNQSGATSIGGTSRNPVGVQASSGNGQNSVFPYTIDSKGDIDFPILGEVHVAGLNREQVAALIKKKIIDGHYITDPKVQVSFYNLHYTVLGEVKSPGVYYINDDDVTVLDAIAEAGDLTITGLRNRVFVTREFDGQRTTYQLDLTSADVYDSPVFYLQQDDMIYVEPNSMRAGQSTVNENSFKSVGMWMTITSFLLSLGVLIFK